MNARHIPKEVPMQTAEVISAEAFDALRTVDELVREEARRIHVEHLHHRGEWYSGYVAATLRGGYDNDEPLVALRAAIRRGIEIGRAA